MRRVLLTIILIALTPGFAASSAEAALNICNKGDASTRMTLGWFDGAHWTSQGWWTITPKTCVRILGGLLKARHYYLDAAAGAAGTWEGKTYFCTAPETKFVIPGREDCAKRGFERHGFFEVDTGNAPDWT